MGSPFFGHGQQIHVICVCSTIDFLMDSPHLVRSGLRRSRRVLTDLSLLDKPLNSGLGQHEVLERANPSSSVRVHAPSRVRAQRRPKILRPTRQKAMEALRPISARQSTRSAGCHRRV